MWALKRRREDQTYQVVVVHVEDERAEERIRRAYDIILRTGDRRRANRAEQQTGVGKAGKGREPEVAESSGSAPDGAEAASAQAD